MKACYAWIAFLVVAGACAPASDGDPALDGDPADGAESVESAQPTDSAAAADGAAERWTPLDVPPAPGLDTFRLLLVNRQSVPIAVFADGGAGDVLLDTVAAADSARVNVIIAADSVTLRAVGPDGSSGSPQRIGLGADSTRWEARF